MQIKLLQNEIADRLLQENFKRLQDSLTADLITSASWRVFRLDFTTDTVNLKIPHGLSFVPEDAVITRQTGTGTVVINYALFSSTDIVLTVSGTSTTDPLAIKLLVGRL